MNAVGRAGGALGGVKKGVGGSGGGEHCLLSQPNPNPNVLLAQPNGLGGRRGGSVVRPCLPTR